MRLSEAAAILEVEQGADKQTVEKAARQQIRKWHPDRWRNASEAEQKRAAEEYAKISKAQQTLQHPDTADPEPFDNMRPASADYSQTPSYQTGAFPDGYDVDAMFNPQSQYSSRHQRPSSQNSPSSYGTRQEQSPYDDVYQDSMPNNRRVKYNAATTFEDTFGAVPDTMEQTLNTMHNADVTRQYRQLADIMKMSMSIIASIIMFGVSFVLLLAVLNVINIMPLTDAGTFGAAVVSILPAISSTPSVFTFGILTILALAKILSYDALIAPLLSRKIPTATPSFICGVDIVLCGIIGYAVSSAWLAPRLLYGMMVLFGILFSIVAVIIRLRREEL